MYRRIQSKLERLYRWADRRTLRGIALLALFCLLFTAGMRVYIDRQLARYEAQQQLGGAAETAAGRAGAATAAGAGNAANSAGEHARDGHSAVMSGEMAAGQPGEADLPGETVQADDAPGSALSGVSTAETAADGALAVAVSQAELEALERQVEALLSQENSKQAYETVLDLWNAELRSLASAVTAGMTPEEQRSFAQEQATFVRDRNAEALQEVENSRNSASENIAYLKKMVELTRQRCYELVEAYG